ncbi:Exopolyphosphatase [Arcticibacter svalbardensis MN12-7]|uniref:Exopolyphosphatase n=1 Tax=Arcticibacter svalbardensis MN12-7 TaxID=1150600 RepID=R9GPM1_9SPHI|nr:exopolyphosphatase [Arcticibacter svalbardensis]EOR93792.1 Exopolyphosphatase [Arcticibacter svalbardensis MN12-7]
MKKQIAVLDLGTNTFHLLIAELTQEQSIKEIYMDKKDVKLGEGGITAGLITAASFQRGVDAMIAFKKVIDSYSITSVYATGTAALRTASNGNDFINKVKEETGITIEIIDGDREASLIYNGVQQAVPIDQSSLILDIGGGSAEFILCNQQEILFKKSYPLGAARLMALYHHSDPIQESDINTIHQYLDEQLADLKLAAAKYKPQILIGSAGAFETFADLAIKKFQLSGRQSLIGYKVSVAHFQSIVKDLILSDHQHRVANVTISPVRVDMIVVAAILAIYVLDELKIPAIALSTYALKEGLLYEKLNA